MTHTTCTEATPSLAETAIGQIAVQLPGATAIFRRLKLDFCCGGQASLREAAGARGVDLAGLEAELAGLQHRDTRPEGPGTEALIDHILTRYHAVHREQLPELIRMARRVEAVHRDHPGVPAGLADLLEEAHGELISHMEKEEQVLFPILRSGGHPMVAHPIGTMRHEHESHGQMLARMMALTEDATPPAQACNTWRALYAGLAQLADDLIQHIHTENNILFPAFETGAGSCGCSH